MHCSDDGEKAKTRLRFCKVSNIRNQLGTVVKSPFLDKMSTPMSTVSGPAGCLCVAFDQASQLDGTGRHRDGMGTAGRK